MRQWRCRVASTYDLFRTLLFRASLPDGQRLYGATGVVAGIGEEATLLQGADDSGRTLLYTPPAALPASTLTHFDPDLHPDMLMEPFTASESSVHLHAGLVPAMFADIGWGVNRGPARLGNCPTQVPILEPGGFIPGANVQAVSNLCRSRNAGNRFGYMACMKEHAGALQNQGAISFLQQLSVLACAATVSP
ncbi:hypothetical protein JWH04_12055 [Xanthomonas melonis]|uniref:hypothetical protein n=1 Tax=Xanthomonas melonis TaxID=56456 RepID=UPI001E508152|nr:hypothetical protein [Xanthomonas melonis]MCD0279661.1 hypothetical protein [Xanthomonas melonis]